MVVLQCHSNKHHSKISHRCFVESRSVIWKVKKKDLCSLTIRKSKMVCSHFTSTPPAIHLHPKRGHVPQPDYLCSEQNRLNHTGFPSTYVCRHSVHNQFLKLWQKHVLLKNVQILLEINTIFMTASHVSHIFVTTVR